MGEYIRYIPSRQIGLVYSPDDNGYYWQETYGKWMTSRIFPTLDEAEKADEEYMEWGE